MPLLPLDEKHNLEVGVYAVFRSKDEQDSPSTRWLVDEVYEQQAIDIGTSWCSFRMHRIANPPEIFTLYRCDPLSCLSPLHQEHDARENWGREANRRLLPCIERVLL
jgi:hypothetical protein